MWQRSVWAVIAGLLFTIVVTTVIDLAFHAAGVFPTPPEPLGAGGAALAISYRIVIGILAGWLTARLAPTHPVKHALILGVIGAVLALVGLAVTWNRNLGPKWYPIMLVVLAIPQTWLGAKLFELRSGGRMQEA